MKRLFLALTVLLSACSNEDVDINCKRAKLLNTGLQLTLAASETRPELVHLSACLTAYVYTMDEFEIKEMASSTEKYEKYISTTIERCEYLKKYGGTAAEIIAEKNLEAMKFVKSQSHCFKQENKK